MKIPVTMAEKFKADGARWRGVADEIHEATGRKFAFDSIQGAVYAHRRKTLRLPNSLGLDQVTTRDAAILALWNLGFDTFEIAKRIGLHEAEIANNLAFLRGDKLVEHQRVSRGDDTGT
jgi:hypothetical protein